MDLAVDTGALRSGSASLRDTGRIAAELHAKADRLVPLAAGAGSHAATEAIDRFVSAWTYGVGVIGHEVDVAAAALDGVATAFEAIEERLAAAGGAVTAVVASFPEPVGLTSRSEMSGTTAGHRWGSFSAPGVNVQLSSATHASQLVPGVPEDLSELAVHLGRFAYAAHDAGERVRGLQVGGWHGQAAAMFTARTERIPAALTVAAEAFQRGGRAVQSHADVLADAQNQAALALVLWRDAETRSKLWRGVLQGVPVGSATDPGAEDMARAVALVNAARVAVEDSAASLGAVLDGACRDAPRDPGLFARIAAAVRAFGAGAAEGTWGLGEGAVGLFALAAKLVPTNAIADPDGYMATLDAVAAGVIAAGKDWKNTLLDWDTWADDPARAAGHAAPALFALVLGAGALRVAPDGADLVARAPGGTHALRDINPQGWKDNCGACAVSLDSTLAGAPASALGSGILWTDHVAAILGLDPASWGVARLAPESITAEIASAGPGARGIVYGGRGSPTKPLVGHYLNVINQSGTVRYLDGQSGEVVEDLSEFTWFGLLRTQ